IHVLADAGDEVPMASLREAVLLELVEMRDQVVLETLVHPCGVGTIELEEVRVREGGGSRLAQCCEDLAEGGAAVGTRQTRDVLRDEPFGGVERQRVNAVCVEGAVVAVESAVLAYGAEVVARETEGERVVLRHSTEVEVAHVCGEDGVIVGAVDVVLVRRGSVRVILDCPSVGDRRPAAALALLTGSGGSESDPARPAEHLSQHVLRHWATSVDPIVWHSSLPVLRARGSRARRQSVPTVEPHTPRRGRQTASMRGPALSALPAE